MGKISIYLPVYNLVLNINHDWGQFMQSVKSKLMARIFLVVASIFLSGEVFSNSLSDVQELCSTVSDSNRQLAKTAGYDIDELCSTFGSLDLEELTAYEDPAPDTPRATVSSAPVINSEDEEVDEVEPKPVQKSKLKPYGYDLFANEPTNFAMPLNIPVSPNYILGPGDELIVIFYGKLNESSVVSINRDGYIDLPELGSVLLSGLNFSEAKEMLQAQIEAQVIGTKINISLGALRSMQVFVLGEAYKPGAYSISALSTITHAIKSAGGVSDIASLRNIQLKRDGKTIAKLDLYELLLFGNINSDIRLKPADVIYIPTVGDTVSLDGEVKRPAIYELKGEATAEELLSLAGGLSPKAFASSARIERIDTDGFMTVIDLDLSKKSDRMIKIQSGDFLKVDSVVANKKSIVSLNGYIHHASQHSWDEGLRLGDIVISKSQFPTQLDLNYGLIAREVEELGELSFVSFKPGNVLAKTGDDAGILLSPRDEIFFFARSYIDENQDGEESKSEKGRQVDLEPLLQRLRSEATLGSPAKIVEIKGAVKIPGFYPLTPEMTLNTLVEAAGGLKESAYQATAEIVRKDEADLNQSKLVTSVINLDDSHSLNAKDSVFIKAKPYYSKKNIVTLGGEVMFPGEYAFSRGEKLSDLIERAGGFTAVADVNAAIFTRQKLKDKEQQELERLRKRINDELTSQSLVASSKSGKMNSQQQLLTEEVLAELKTFEAIGRLVIPLQGILADKADDVILETGDTLLIPQFRQEVSVVGEVQRPTSYFYDKRLSYKDYIRQSGGFLQSANKKGVYIVKASGEVIMPRGKFLFLPKPGVKVVAGDTIVVPLDTNEKPVRGVKLLTEISQILYQLSLGAAAINSLNN